MWDKTFHLHSEVLGNLWHKYESEAHADTREHQLHFSCHGLKFPKFQNGRRKANAFYMFVPWLSLPAGTVGFVILCCYPIIGKRVFIDKYSDFYSDGM